ncbi:MAG: ATP-binding protein [Candidatus Thermoplasmatota archaeon]|nr:ATP-binding protein [Candidatus Thermoplasmatota archaeon]
MLWKKKYFIDTALAKLLCFRPSEDHGRLLENMVYIALGRKGYEMFFHRGNRECDLVVRRNGTITDAIQVTVDLENAGQRDIQSLMEALYRYDLDMGLILTWDQDGEMMIENE